MLITRTHLHRAVRLSAISFFVSAALISCRGAKQTPPQPNIYSAQAEQENNQAKEVGPPPPEGLKPDAGTVGPLPTSDFVPPQDGYVLVLGPGLARGLAYIGVIRALEEKQVPIRGIVGVEMGAMIGAVWAGANSNILEWEMHKLKRDTLFDFPLLGLRGKVAQGKKLLSFLDKALKIQSLQKMKIPLYVLSAAKADDKEDILTESSGNAKEIIRGAMSIPGIIEAFEYEGRSRFSAALESPFPVAVAKGLGIGKTLCVDVLNRGDNFRPKDQLEQNLSTLMRSISTVARQQLKECDVVVSIPLDGIGYLSFEEKADLVYRGRLAALKWLGQQNR